MQTTTLDRVDLATITEALTEAYRDYFIPIVFTEPATAAYLQGHDINLEASPLWLENGKAVAVGAIGLRTNRAWVGAFGIAPEYRGSGLAHAMFGEVIAAARRLDATTIQLEVLDCNRRALKVYERHGFTATRSLVSLQSPTIEPVSAAHAVEVGEALRWSIQAEPVACWQREIRTLELRCGLLDALRLGKSFAIYRRLNGEAAIVRADLHEDDADALLGGIVKHAGARVLSVGNEPEDSRLLQQLYGRAWTPTFRQHEMRLRL